MTDFDNNNTIYLNHESPNVWSNYVGKELFTMSDYCYDRVKKNFPFYQVSDNIYHKIKDIEYTGLKNMSNSTINIKNSSQIFKDYLTLLSVFCRDFFITGSILSITYLLIPEDYYLSNLLLIALPNIFVLAFVNIINKLSHDESQYIEQDKYIKKSLFNYIMMNLLIYSYISLINIESTKPSMSEYFTQIGFYYLCQELYFYWVHRLFHINPLFKWIHSVHHRTYANNYITAFYMHPLEIILLVLPSSIIGSFICLLTNHKVYKLCMLGWMITGMFYILWSHTGLNFWWMPSTEYHWKHHKYLKYNFSGYPLDNLFGTDYDKNKRNRDV